MMEKDEFNSVLDEREMNKIDELTNTYLAMTKSGAIDHAISNLNDKVSNLVPDFVKQGYSDALKNMSESDFIIQTLKVAAEGFKELESRAVKLTVSKKQILKNISKTNPNIQQYDEICKARSYEIEKSINFKEYEHIFLTILQASATGFVGFPGIPFNMALSTFLYFRAVQSIALHFGYDVIDDMSELEFASEVTLMALSPNRQSGIENLSTSIGKMMIMTKSTALVQGLNKGYVHMAKQGGVQLLYVQIRAYANQSARKALEKSGQKQLEQSMYTEMLEQLGKYFTQSAGKKAVPAIGAVLSAFVDTKQMLKILKYAKTVYHKRYLLEKEIRISRIDNLECSDAEIILQK